MRGKNKTEKPKRERQGGDREERTIIRRERGWKRILFQIPARDSVSGNSAIGKDSEEAEDKARV